MCMMVIKRSTTTFKHKCDRNLYVCKLWFMELHVVPFPKLFQSVSIMFDAHHKMFVVLQFNSLACIVETGVEEWHGVG